MNLYIGTTVDVEGRTGTVRDLYCKGKNNDLFAEVEFENGERTTLPASWDALPDDPDDLNVD